MVVATVVMAMSAQSPDSSGLSAHNVAWPAIRYGRLHNQLRNLQAFTQGVTNASM